ncbi:MAG TPA: carboxypeptidase regulatory-like domain-containing protein [Acidobacteriaceae bacterium]|nr:carboxypeptidase regulatory-like domain-containing protein [Acidobacteriaceae bacterium]
MRRFVLVACVLIVGCLAMARSVCRAQNTTAIQGRVVDSTGAVISGAAVTLTDLTTNTSVSTTSGADGQFVFNDVSLHPQFLSVVKSGFENFTQRVKPTAQSARIVATMKVAALSQSVTVQGTVNPEASPVPSRDDVMMKPNTLVVLDQKILEAAGPVAGGAQMLKATPGANVFGYGETGATKYSIILNGLQQGWAGEATGFTGTGSLGITYDGIPVVDPATGLWQSATMPQSLVIQDIAVTYGPGEPMNRWYSDVGGRVEFTPIQPTVERHFTLSGTQGPYGTQNFALVGNTGMFRGWSTVLGGGLGRGDSFRVAPDGFGNHAQSGSVYGKSLKTFSAGSVAMGVLYAKGGGYRPTVIPTTDIGLIDPMNGQHFSQATSGFYSSLPYAAYNKYDTNEMFMTYGREHLFLGPKATLRNTTWYTHIRRFHRRNDDALSQGAQVDEWNNPHSNIFGDEVGFTQVFPWNTVDIGGYLLHEVYNPHNLFYNPADGGSGALQIVGQGSKFRSGYFQQDDVTFYAQDDIHPIPQIHIIPGLAVNGFSTSYSDQAARDFSFAPGTHFYQNSSTGPVVATSAAVYETHCALNPTPPPGLTLAQDQAIDPYYDLWGEPVQTSDGSSTQDQGSLCGAHESRSALSPSIDASVTPMQWLTIYGDYDITNRSPEFGGGGGLFQKVNPAYYIMSKGSYGQFGGKVHFTHAPGFGNFIAGVDYYHLNYDNQEIDVETATGVELTSGGNTTYHGVDAFFNSNPRNNVTFFVNLAGEASNYNTYVTGGTIASCGSSYNAAGAANGCAYYNNLPVSYTPDETLNAGVYYGIQHHGREILEPRFFLQTVSSQHLWSNNTGAPVTRTMPAYTTSNLSFLAPFRFEKQALHLQLDVMNLANSQYNEFEYVSSGGYFASLFPTSNYPSGYINAYPGAPRAVFGTVTYQF